MAIKLITKEERHSCLVEGVTFFYRRILNAEVQEINELHTSRGVVDDEAVNKEIMQRCILGWEGPLLGADGKPVPYSAELLMALPMPVQLKLADIVVNNIDGKHVKADPI